MNMLILAGDIGGTNTRLLLSDGEDTIRAEKNYLSCEYTGLINVLKSFISEFNIALEFDAVCMAVAGPVKSGQASITNLPWVISESELSHFLKTENVSLINDFIAVSYGISRLSEADFLVIQQTEYNTQNQDAAVIGAGTGLGASHLIYRHGEYLACPSEAGHAAFAPENELQTQLLTSLQKSNHHVSLENILSGRGLLIIYEFLRLTNGILESNEVRQAMQDEDPARVITEYALLESDQLCEKTLDIFVEIYASAAGNIALHYYPVGSVYLAGGIAIKIKDKLNSQRFIDAFINKGLMSENMKQLSIKLILDDRVGLQGAVKYASINSGVYQGVNQ